MIEKLYFINKQFGISLKKLKLLNITVIIEKDNDKVNQTKDKT